MSVLSSTLGAIGNTPVIELRRMVPEGSARVLVKWEGSNPTGSHKDRMVLSMIEGAEGRGELQPGSGSTVVEFTGGSTGSSLAFVCAAKGYRFRVVSSDAFSREKLATMAAFGTAGMLMGVSSAFQKAGQSPRIVLLEPAASPIVTQGISGAHKIEGVGVGFRPPMLNDDLYDEARTVDEPLARETARRLAREEGIFTGISGGMNVAAALELAREFGPAHTIATVACDTGLKYLAGDLFSPETLATA